MTVDAEKDFRSTGLKCVAVLGDSSAAGFGTGGRGFPVLAGEGLGALRLENLSQFSRTTKLMVEEDVSRIDEIRPDVVIVSIGMADSLLSSQWRSTNTSTDGPTITTITAIGRLRGMRPSHRKYSEHSIGWN